MRTIRSPLIPQRKHTQPSLRRTSFVWPHCLRVRGHYRCSHQELGILSIVHGQTLASARTRHLAQSHQPTGLQLCQGYNHHWADTALALRLHQRTQEMLSHMEPGRPYRASLPQLHCRASEPLGQDPVNVKGRTESSISARKLWRTTAASLRAWPAATKTARV